MPNGYLGEIPSQHSTRIMPTGPNPGRQNYRSPWNDPNSARYGGGAPRPQAPSYPGAGQTGTGYGSPMSGSPGYSRNVPAPSLDQGWGQMSGSPGYSRNVPAPSLDQGWGQMSGIIGSRSGPLPAPNLGYSRNVPAPSLDQGWGQMSGSPQQAYNPAGATGWQSPQVDEERRRRMLLQQQQAGPMGVQQMYPQGWGPQINNQQVPMGGIGQVSSGFAESPYQGNFTQPFPTKPPWQERIPQTFNQGAAYGPYARSW